MLQPSCSVVLLLPHFARVVLLLEAPQFASAVGMRAAQAQREARKNWPSKTDFLRRLLASRANTPAYVFDVGANDGAWTREMMRQTEKATQNVNFVVVEPQSRFRDVLGALVSKRPGSEFLAAAAWTRGGVNLTLATSRDTRAASVVPQSQRQQTRHSREGVSVSAVDLAALMLRTLPPPSWMDRGSVARGTASALAYLHLDGAPNSNDKMQMCRRLLCYAACHVLPSRGLAEARAEPVCAWLARGFMCVACAWLAQLRAPSSHCSPPSSPPERSAASRICTSSGTHPRSLLRRNSSWKRASACG